MHRTHPMLRRLLRALTAIALLAAFFVAVPGGAASADPVTLTVVDEDGNGVPGGVATPACGGSWYPTLPGTTDANGKLVAVLPACTTKVKMEVNQGSVEQTNDEMAASNHTWTTEILRIWLKDHTGSAILDQAGILDQGGGYWYAWGTFNAYGYRDIPLFARSGAYKFRVTYNLTNQELFPVVTAGAGIQDFDFQTGQVFGECITQYNTGAWSPFTDGMELMPGTRIFRYPSQDATVTVGEITDLNWSCNQPPEADAGEPYSGYEGSPIDIDGSGSTDIDGNIATYAWTIAPPPGPQGTCTILAPAAATTSVTCDDNGVWNLTLTVTDDDGATDSDTTTLASDNVAPEIQSLTPNHLSVLTGASVIWAATATDPGSNDTHTWDFDGGAGSGTTLTAEYTTSYAACGTFALEATVTDDDGGFDTETSTDTVGVSEGTVLPPLNPVANNLVQKGQVVPVKIRVGCQGAYVSDLRPDIALLKGDRSAANDTSVDNPVTDSVSGADTSGIMRGVDSMYMYNLRVPFVDGGGNALVKGDLLTIRIRPFGMGGGTIDIVLEIRK